MVAHTPPLTSVKPLPQPCQQLVQLAPLQLVVQPLLHCVEHRHPSLLQPLLGALSPLVLHQAVSCACRKMAIAGP